MVLSPPNLLPPGKVRAERPRERGEPAGDGDAGSGLEHPTGWADGSVEQGGVLGAGGDGREGAVGIFPSFRGVPFQVPLQERGPRHGAARARSLGNVSPRSPGTILSLLP